MKRKFSKILGVGLTVALITSLLLVAAPVSALTQLTVVPSSATISATTSYTVTFNTGKELSPPVTLINVGDGNATWSTAEAQSLPYSVLLDAGTGLEASAGRIRVGVPAILMADFNAATFYVWAAAWTNWNAGAWSGASGGTATYTSWPYGTPYINILIDTDGDGAWDDKLEGIGSVPVSPAIHDTPPSEDPTDATWVEMEEVFYYDQDNTMAAASGYGPPLHVPGSNQASDLATWKTWFATYHPTWTVVGIEITFGFWGILVNQDVYVDDIEINGVAPVHAAHNTITLTFPPTTLVPETLPAGATIVASPGWISGQWKDATTTGVTFVSDDALRTVTATLNAGDEIGEGATVRIAIPGITNPPAIGSYNLTLKTSAETTVVTSAAYAIGTPTILPLPGVVERYNSAGVLMAQTNKIQVAIDAASAGDTIDVGPGTYDEALIINKSITITGDAVTTIIKDVTGGTVGGTVIISFVGTTLVAGAVFDGFTVMGRPGVDALTITGENVTVQNSIFTKAGTATTTLGQSLIQYNPTVLPTLKSTITNNTFDTTLGIVQDAGVKVAATANAIGLTISNNTFTIDQVAVGTEDSAIDTAGEGTALLPITISGNTISGGSGIGITISGIGTTKVTSNSLSSLNQALNITGTGVGAVTVEGNTIDACGLAVSTTLLTGQAAIQVASVGTGGLSITNNTITNSPNDIIEVILNSDRVNMIFNNLTDNAKGIDNNENNANILNATHNWWGVDTGPAAGMNVELSVTLGQINTTAYLGSEAAGTLALDKASLITKTTVGVDVVATPATGKDAPAIIGVANYAANPQDATPLPAIAGGFYDVYLADVAAGNTASVLIKFYNANVTANTKVYAWGTIAGGWQLVTATGTATAQGVNLFEGFAFATITSTTTPSITGLAGTPFALVEAPTGALTVPLLLSPDAGERDVPLTPTFSWTQIGPADGYYFEFADNANFLLPLMKLDGDGGRLIVTAYAYVTELPYSTAYYWRVRAVSGTIAGGDLAQSAWTSGVFITMDEPVEPTPPVIIEEAPILPDITIEQPDIIIESPDIIVPLPDVAAPITPGWIYVIIGVGAVLVIALIVLVVRTRRVA